MIELAHGGSTSVPGLWAKPVIDVELTVADSGDEPSWLPDLEEAGFVLRIREPDWEEQRMVLHGDPRANVHVWPPGALEPRRPLAFARWLAEHPVDLTLYADLERRLADEGLAEAGGRYNNAKAGLVYDLYERIFAADENHWHDPCPRPLA